MENEFLLRIAKKVEIAKSDSDFSYFFSLLSLAECAAKMNVLGLLSAIVDDKDRNRYRLEHSLARSDGLGDWGRAIEDVLSGQASQFLLIEARTEQSELAKNTREGEWQYECVSAMKATLNALEIEAEDIPVKTDMKRWFRLFTTLRNKTRGHGIVPLAKAGEAAEHLARSIELFTKNHIIFKRPWAYLHRNLSGKYRVISISGEGAPYEYLKKSNDSQFYDGVYIFFDRPRAVPLIHCDPDFDDFYLANGGFNGKRFEYLSYVTGDKTYGEADQYSVPPGSLPASETEGRTGLDAKGNCFTNAPESPSEFVLRPKLEDELFSLLIDDRRPIITLVGRGGIGKTSLALHVLPKIFETTRFDQVIWFSARDIDLQTTGPKPVRPNVLTPADIGALFAKMVLKDSDISDRSFNAKDYFEKSLGHTDIGRSLFVFDNFETTQNPIDLYRWIDTFIRLPNKILITTRLRDFKGDYPVDVHGMEDEEARELVYQVASRLGISSLLTSEYVEKLITDSGGHPYVIKIALGEVANARKLIEFRQTMAGSDEILTALFERTYASLSPCAQRAFLTLSAWNSAVPRIALEAVLLRSTSERREVEKGLDTLLQYSMAEAGRGKVDEQEFIALPLVASIFGKRKLTVSPLRAAIQADVEILQMLGATRLTDIHLGMAKRMQQFISSISRRVDRGESLDPYLPILEMICQTYYPGWLAVARLYAEAGGASDKSEAIQALRRYLEAAPISEEEQRAEAWRELASLCRAIGDTLGEVHALIERSQLAVVPFFELSNTANLLNRMLHEHRLEVDPDERKYLADKLVAVLRKRRKEADADDFSRMAWLSFNLGDPTTAYEYVTCGLEYDSTNAHCVNLLRRLEPLVGDQSHMLGSDSSAAKNPISGN